SMVNDLLSVSRIHSPGFSLQLEPLQIAQVVEEVLAGIKSSTDKHEFSVDIPGDLPQLLADRDKLSQVLMNLLDNAIKYSPEGGRVVVSAEDEPEQQKVVVRVADQGIGIASEHQQTLFTTFSRIRRPETEGITGTGLGLYIVKELLQLMGGEVWLESNLNQGSTFSFTLPACQSVLAQDRS
ncbi:MAG: hypothetical protein IH848_00485, partial [Acidobacteria bacterium]|nr:hypothetical protein [Acidobacteriota bacterium]